MFLTEIVIPLFLSSCILSQSLFPTPLTSPLTLKLVDSIFVIIVAYTFMHAYMCMWEYIWIESDECVFVCGVYMVSGLTTLYWTMEFIPGKD